MKSYLLAILLVLINFVVLDSLMRPQYYLVANGQVAQPDTGEIAIENTTGTAVENTTGTASGDDPLGPALLGLFLNGKNIP
jgi:hypothetical protein